MLGYDANMSNSSQIELGNMVRNARVGLGINQTELGRLIGKSRHWVVQLERGLSYDTEKEKRYQPETCVRLAAVLNLDPVEVLHAARIPSTMWPDLSYMYSKSGIISTIDVTALTEIQQKLVRELIEELKAGNDKTQRN